MSIVGRKGKLSVSNRSGTVTDINWQRIEDILTADVIGAYRYLPVADGLLRFLLHARDENRKSLEDFLTESGTDTESLTYAQIRLWPTLADGREPDALLLMGSSPEDLSVAILVEAKLNSKQHEIDGRSQLGHYARGHADLKYSGIEFGEPLPAFRAVVYVTAHSHVPVSELERARSEVGDKSIPVLWVPWSKAGEEARLSWMSGREDVANRPWQRLYLDICDDLEERDLMPRDSFGGFHGYSDDSLTPKVYARRPVGVSHCIFSGALSIRSVFKSTYISDALLQGVPAFGQSVYRKHTNKHEAYDG